eukprot:6173083-Pleurochrysis_carterae.AAC.2
MDITHLVDRTATRVPISVLPSALSTSVRVPLLKRRLNVRSRTRCSSLARLPHVPAGWTSLCARAPLRHLLARFVCLSITSSHSEPAGLTDHYLPGASLPPCATDLSQLFISMQICLGVSRMTAALRDAQFSPLCTRRSASFVIFVVVGPILRSVTQLVLLIVPMSISRARRRGLRSQHILHIHLWMHSRTRFDTSASDSSYTSTLRSLAVALACVFPPVP